MIIQLNHITKRYGKKVVLNDFTLELKPGVYGLLGPNGAGKSTLINIIAGLVRKDYGEILFDGKPVEKMGEDYLDHLGYLPQTPRLYENYTVKEFMRYMCVLKGVRKQESEQKIEELLAFVNLAEHGSQKIGKLSGGMKQRVGIAQALINDPEFVIFDEPTAGLDPLERIRFRSLLTEIAKERVVLLATHIVSDISFVATRVLLLRQGQLIQNDTPENMIQSLMGKVCTITVSSDEIPCYLSKYQVSSARYSERGCELRIVSDCCGELVNASQVCPNLEDVYLYYFGQEATQGGVGHVLAGM